MTPERFSRIGEVYEAVDSAPEAEQTALLARLCGDDDALREAVAALLSPDPASADAIAEAIGGEASAWASDAASADALAGPESRPERIGRYRIVRRIGQGGMGAVYEAVRVDDFNKRVALKVIRGDLDAPAARQRFAQERQLLANLEHPNIARLLDGGETLGGSPYLVLEYVDGEPLLAFCARLDRAGALRVFLTVCEAVDHAHRNLVIHRDLKPSNILVTTDGEPKLLDFGIATLIRADALATETHVGAMTLAFASPEQILGRPMSTATDVYSLGVVLYRLLTGRLPYDLEGATPARIERMVCVDPAAPAGLDDDLDAILGMALRKEPERRYGSARRLAEDIQRHLDHLPVVARPDTLAYRARKFARRRWPALIAASAVVLAVAVGTGATLYQARVAQDRFSQLRRLAHAFVFDYGDDLARVEGTTAVRERMVGAALAYLGGLSKQAGDDPGLLRELAAAYAKVGDTQGNPSQANLGHADQALASYATAARLYDRAVARDPASAGEVAAFYVDYAKLLVVTGRPAEAARASAAAFRDLELAGRSGGGDAVNRPRLAKAWCVLGDAAQSPTLQWEEYHRCNLIAQDVVARWPTWENRKLQIAALIRDAGDLVDVGRTDEAVPALDTEQRLLDAALAKQPHDPELRKRQTMLEQIYSRTFYDDMGPSLGDGATSVVHARRYLDLARRGVAFDPQNAASRFSLAVGLFRLSFPLKASDPAGAIRGARESVDLFEAMIAQGQGSPLVVSRLARAERRLGEALLFAGRTEAAAPWIDRALADHEKQVAAAPGDFDEAANLVIAVIDVGRLADARQDPARGLDFLTRAEASAAAISRRDPTSLPAAVLVVRARQELAGHWRRVGDVGQAAAWMEAAQKVWRTFPTDSAYVRRMAASDAAIPR